MCWRILTFSSPFICLRNSVTTLPCICVYAVFASYYCWATAVNCYWISQSNKTNAFFRGPIANEANFPMKLNILPQAIFTWHKNYFCRYKQIQEDRSFFLDYFCWYFDYFYIKQRYCYRIFQGFSSISKYWIIHKNIGIRAYFPSIRTEM